MGEIFKICVSVKSVFWKKNLNEMLKRDAETSSAWQCRFQGKVEISILEHGLKKFEEF